MQDRNGSNDTPGYLPAPVPNGREQEPRDGWKGEAPKPVESRTPPKQQEGPRATFAAVKPPSLNLPKGGGALRGIGETFKTNPVTGTASAQIPLPITPAPHGPSPELTLSYDSGSGNGLFGLGWGVGVPQIARKTDKQLPEYLDREDSDIFILGGDDLVPRFKEDQLNGWVRDNGAATEGTVDYSIERFRPRTEGAFSKVERWTNTDTLESHWRVTSRDNATSFFGRTTESRIAGPEQSTIDPKKPQRVYSWLLDRVVDDRGHVVEYRYAAEDLTGVSATKCSEAARVDGLVAVENRHLKRVLYGNRNVWPTATPDFKLELVFDYGEHHATTPLPNDDVSNDWTVRQDPFSSFRAGFDMRTYRLCRRVLMFHRFTELHSTEPTLVRALELTYAATPKVTQLTSAKMRGFTRDGSSYTSADLPALALTYTEAAFTRDIEALGEGDALDFNPQSLTKFAQWVDLDGEGLPGVLTDRGGALHYKRNLGDGHLDGSVQLPSAPNLSLRDRGSAQLMDVAGSGNMSVVKLDPGASGYFEREGDGWAPFRTFASNPNIDWADPNLRMVDLNGDGFDDILITRGDYLIWYPSLARDGYGPPQRVPLPREEERGPTVIFAGRYSSIFLADMNGDGLADLVQVLHSRVAYWPNLGHGRFGAQIVMDDSPQIDAPHLFHPSRVRLADLDGTGTADLVYFDTGGMHVWPNLSGNAFGTKLTNECFPVPEGLPTLAIIDLHGVGMSTFAWAPKRGTTEPVRHTSPFGKKKPFLLQSMENGMGLEVRFEYASSTKFYLADREAGRPWATKLPFPVQVLTKVESYDAISKTRLVSKYAYHHGHYDTLEREFRGFGMVEQVDAETFDDAQGSTLFPNLPVANGELSQPPVLSKSWFHLGAWLEQKSLETAFSAEYWDGDTGAPNPLTCIVEPGLKPDELPEAHRALRGTLLRQEVFGHTRVGNAWALDAIPFSVTSASYEVRRIQPRLPAAGADRPRLRGVFHTVERESRDHYYDRVANDPRFSQTLALDVDDYGVVTRRAAIAYPRRTSSVHAEQNEIHCVVTETDVVHLDAETTGYRLAVPLETRAYELTGLSTSTLYTPESLESDYGDATPRAYHDGLEGGLERRIVERVMVVYYDSDLTNPLLPGQTNLRALPYETYHLDLTDDLLADVMGDKVTSDMLSNGKYAEFNDDGNHWIPSGRSVPNASRFYLPDSYRDPFGSVTTVTYDAHDFFVTEMEDALDNTVVADIDYRVFAPSLVTDPNGNRVEAAFDPLGRVTKVAVMGKTTESLGDTLADPTETFEYALDRWSQGKPNYSKHRAREQHGSANPRWQESYVYTDGSGRVAMAKIQAEAGEAHQYDSQTGEVIRDTETGAPVLAVTSTRWVGTGKTVLNNKGNPVKQYEPFFSPTHEYEDEEDLTQIGVTSIVTYDAVGRATRVDLPDETFSTTSWTPWTQVVADENDNETGGDHENTPTVTHVDTMGRPFLVVADNGNTELFEMRTTLDIEGQVLAVTDQLGRICQTNKFSMAGRLLYETNIDKGERWNLTAADGAPIQRWDKRDQVFRWEYDELRRPTHLWVKIGTADEVLLERRYYGDNPNLTTPEADNLRGRPILLFDGAGKTEVGPYDFKGNVKESSRTLASTYDAIVDWSDLATVTNPATAESTAAADLESETWTETREYDALGRITSLIAPDISEFLPAYNEANLLESVAVKVRGATSATTFVSDIDYNAKGQRLSIAYGNGVTTQYTYDPKRFRLTRLLTTRTSPTSATLQDLNYSYDPVGNIVGIQDDALQTVFFANQVVDGSQTFTYDATYRLIAASGREHSSQTASQVTEADAPLQSLPHANQLDAVRNYNEQYTYDAVGNILELFHQGVGSPAATWTRYYDYGPLDNGIARTNRLRSSSLSGDTENIVPYQAQNVHDNHGNITSMPHLSSITYSPFDQMASASNGTQTTYFVYGGDGQRVRKVYDTNANLIKERIYLGGFEIYRERVSGATQLERQTLHVFDGAQRIAMVETKTVDGGSSVTTPVPKYRFQLTNHLGSAMLEVDEAGLVISYEEYHPYGTSAYRSSNGSAEVSARRYRYTGKERDEETGLYYHGARYYAPWLARWTSADPLGIGADGPGVYNYVSGSPINLVDPSGMEERSTWEQLVFAARAHPSTNGIVRRAENLGALLKGVRQSLDRMDRTDVMLAETLPLDNPYRAELLAGDEENAPSVIDQISEAYSAGDNPAEGVRNVVNIFNPIVIGVEAFTAMMEARDKGDFEEAGRHLPALAGAVAGAYSFATGLIPSLFGGGGGAGPAMALAGGGTATLAVEGPAAAAVGASGGPAGFALGLAISMSVGEGDAAGPASTVTNADRLRADLKLSETLTNKKIVVREPIAPNSTNRPALFDTKTGELIIGKTTDPGHFGVLQNTRLPIEEGRYAGGWVQVDSSGAIVFEAESGTFPWSNPALPHNTLDRIRGTGVTVVQPEY